MPRPCACVLHSAQPATHERPRTRRATAPEHIPDLLPTSTRALFFSSRGPHTRCLSDWSSDVCSSDLLSGRREPEALVGARVSANFLDILNVKPRLGRSFLEEEDAPGAPPVAMISGRLWRRVFQGDPQVVGKTATLNAIPHIIIGVLPDNFAFPFVGTDIWMARPAEWSVIPPGARPH